MPWTFGSPLARATSESSVSGDSVRGQSQGLRPDPRLRGRLRLRADVGEGGGILSDEQDAQKGDDPAAGEALRGDPNPLADRTGHEVAVQEDCRGS